ncbi:MAG: hypothetical protein JWO62_593 [Acidimicrobiaceae bacterium]|nr:hypothetical protein [Acidimicrobiaceae bacterium]
MSAIHRSDSPTSAVEEAAAKARPLFEELSKADEAITPLLVRWDQLAREMGEPGYWGDLEELAADLQWNERAGVDDVYCCIAWIIKRLETSFGGSPSGLPEQRYPGQKYGWLQDGS